MYNPVIAEIYLNRLTDNGRRFFELFVAEIHHTPLMNDLELRDETGQLQFTIAFDPLIRQWHVKAPDTERMFLLEFASFIGECSFHEAFWLIRNTIYPLTVQSTNWKSAVELASHQVRPLTRFEFLSSRLKDLSKEQIEGIIAEEIENEKLSRIRDVELITKKYETTPAEVLHFYLRPGRPSESIFWTATMVVSFMQSQHPGFWKLSEEETGRLLNSEGFVICKGRSKGKRGYFIDYQPGFHPGKKIELKEAS